MPDKPARALRLRRTQEQPSEGGLSVAAITKLVQVAVEEQVLPLQALVQDLQSELARANRAINLLCGAAQDIRSIPVTSVKEQVTLLLAAISDTRRRADSSAVEDVRGSRYVESRRETRFLPLEELVNVAQRNRVVTYLEDEGENYASFLDDSTATLSAAGMQAASIDEDDIPY